MKLYIPEYKHTTPSTGGVLKNYCSMKSFLIIKYTKSFICYEDNNKFYRPRDSYFFQMKIIRWHFCGGIYWQTFRNKNHQGGIIAILTLRIQIVWQF